MPDGQEDGVILIPSDFISHGWYYQVFTNPKAKRITIHQNSVKTLWAVHYTSFAIATPSRHKKIRSIPTIL